MLSWLLIVVTFQDKSTLHIVHRLFDFVIQDSFESELNYYVFCTTAIAQLIVSFMPAILPGIQLADQKGEQKDADNQSPLPPPPHGYYSLCPSLYCLPSVALLSSSPQHPEPSYKIKLLLNMSHVPLLLQVFHLNTQWNSQHYAVLKPVCCAIFHSVCTAYSAQQGGVIQYFQRFSKSNTFLLIRYILKRSNPKNRKLWPRNCACGTVFI